MAFHAFADFGDDAKGESLDDGHKDQIQILSLSHNVVQPKSTSRMVGGGTVDQAEFGDYVIRKYADKATPKLLELASNGKHVAKVTIEIMKPVGGNATKYLVHELKNVVVHAYQTDADGGGTENYPIETITLGFDHVAVTYTQVAQDGTSKGNTAFKWDRAKAKSA
jgi:type VI secretion system secreted protein Hcp